MKTYFSYDAYDYIENRESTLIPTYVFNQSRTVGQYVIIKDSTPYYNPETDDVNVHKYVYEGRIINWMNPETKNPSNEPNQINMNAGFRTIESELSITENCEEITIHDNQDENKLVTHTVHLINTVEWTNPYEGNPDPDDQDPPANIKRGLVNPGVDMCGEDYPEGFSLQPISKGTIVFARPLFGSAYTPNTNSDIHTTFPFHIGDALALQTPWAFQLTNQHDGSCETPE